MNELWQQIQPILITTLVSIASILLLAAKRWVESKISGDRHFRAASIVMDAVVVAVQRMGPEVTKMLADGKLSKDELDALKNMARGIAKERLSQLRGLAVERLGGWLETQLDVSLGKLQMALLGGASETEIGPDDPAI